MTISGPSAHVGPAQPLRLRRGASGLLRAWATDTLAPAIAFVVTGYSVAATFSAYTVFVLGTFDPKFGAAGTFELDLKFLLFVWSLYCMTFLLAAGTVRLAIVYRRLLNPSWTPERAVATNPHVGRRILTGFLLGAAFSLATALLQPPPPWPWLLVGALGAPFGVGVPRPR